MGFELSPRYYSIQLFGTMHGSLMSEEAPNNVTVAVRWALIRIEIKVGRVGIRCHVLQTLLV